MEKNLNFKNGMRKNDNKFYPLLFALSGFIYSALAGVLDFFVNPKENSWASLCFVVPMIAFSVFTLFICAKKIKAVKPKDIYIPPIVLSLLFIVATYGFTLIYPDMFLRTAYWSLLDIYAITAICVLIITVIPKIPHKRFVVLSYLGIVIFELFAITSAVYNCFVKITANGFYLDVLFIIRENIIN